MSKTIPHILIGTDPEVFLRSKSTGRMISAHGQFPGTKDEPFPLDRGALQVDGHALEFNTDPVGSENEFLHVVNHVFNQVKGFVHETNSDWEVVLEPVARFDSEYFDTLPDESKVLGCTPDFSAVTGKQLDAPDISKQPLRTGSGHIHIGWTQFDDAFDEAEFRKRLVLANRITPYLLKTAEKWENADSTIRRQYYGREGAFRPKHYGVELRALDNLWLKDDASILEVFRTTKAAFEKECHHAL
jgi:hypothetical protein